MNGYVNATEEACFRPLDGESFSKQFLKDKDKRKVIKSFRPLDGESFSKLFRKLYDQ